LTRDTPPTPKSPADHIARLQVGARERRYLVHVPPGYDGSTPVPVVLMFHGAGGTARWTVAETGWADKADEATFLAVFPEGVPAHPSRPATFRTNPQLWNDGSSRGLIGKRNIDDVGFVDAVLDDLSARFAVDRRRVYAAGFSNGGGLVFRLGAELSTRIAAIAPVASHCWLKHPQPQRPVPTIYLIGSDDPLTPLEGGEIHSPFGGTATMLSVWESLATWARAFGCSPEPRVVRHDGGVQVYDYGPGQEGAELIVYVIEGLGHHWPGGKGQLSQRPVGRPSDRVKANDVIWEFFQRHPMP
jgi:polyhydroxybutyrate depolymerase